MRVLIGASLAAVVSASAHAQRIPAESPWRVRRCPVLESCVRSTRPGQLSYPRAIGSRPADWWAPVASAVVPGIGQARLRQDRFVAYLAVEAFAWLSYATDLHEYQRRRSEYQELARQIARRLFASSTPVGDFDYYEKLEHFVESGVFDQSPGNAFTPETDSTTANGATWLQARQTFWDDPQQPPDATSDAFQRAITFYQQRAIRPEFRWSWRNAQLEQDTYRRTIARSNLAFRGAISDLGLVLANHALSTVDAYISVRIRRAPTNRGMSIESSIPLANIFRGYE